MPSRRVIAQLKVTRLTDVEPLVWCDICMLPSAEKVTLAVDMDDVAWFVAVLQYCPDCGRTEIP